MTDPVIAQRAPYPVKVEAGKTYYWCACGNSKKERPSPTARQTPDEDTLEDCFY